MSDKFKSYLPKNYKFKSIIYKKEDYKAVITINRESKLNCLDLETINELTLAFKDSSWDDNIAVIIPDRKGEACILNRR
ncbi:MAG: hypothetical protein IPL53_16745 [Ignavibacteria bacterium]|nr:hypothetical protein [Ignavibacteria bacterium]